VDKIPSLFYFETVHGFSFEPTEYVDITEEIELKRAMCYEHKSQIQWMQDNYKDANTGKDFFEHMMITAKFRGMQCGVEYAEGFRMAYNGYRVHPTRLLP